MIICKQSSGQCFVYLKGLCKILVMNKGNLALVGNL